MTIKEIARELAEMICNGTDYDLDNGAMIDEIEIEIERIYEEYKDLI